MAAGGEKEEERNGMVKMRGVGIGIAEIQRRRNWNG